MTVEKPKILVFLHRNLLISLGLLLRKTSKLDFFDTYEKVIIPLMASPLALPIYIKEKAYENGSLGNVPKMMVIYIMKNTK